MQAPAAAPAYIRTAPSYYPAFHLALVCFGLLLLLSLALQDKTILQHAAHINEEVLPSLGADDRKQYDLCITLEAMHELMPPSRQARDPTLHQMATMPVMPGKRAAPAPVGASPSFASARREAMNSVSSMTPL